MKIEDQRRIMVEEQLQGRDITDERVLDAFRTVPRHEFVSEELQHFAYHDNPLGIGAGQTISQPYMVAKMLQLMCIQPTDTVLEIGTGSGYQTALLAELALQVYTIERVRSLGKKPVDGCAALNTIISHLRSVTAPTAGGKHFLQRRVLIKS